MQPLASDNPGNFHGAALNARVGEQHLTQGATTQLCEPAAAATQGDGRNQRSGKDPGPITADELHLACPRASIQAQVQDQRFIPAGTAPTLPEHPHLEPVWAALAHAPGQ